MTTLPPPFPPSEVAATASPSAPPPSTVSPASSFTRLEIDVRGRVATLWLNRPDVHNAFDHLLIAELRAAFQQIDHDAHIRVMVLAGRGKSFSAGADLNWMKRAATYSETENLSDAQAMADMLRALHDMSKPTVARVQGAALGGGTGLVAACDIAIAADPATFALSEVRFGIIPATISPFVLAAIGARAAHRYFLSAERFDAREAARLGLVHEVCASEALDARIEAVVAALLLGGPDAQKATKALIAEVSGKPIDAAISADTASRIASIRATGEARDGIAAFLEKRKPRWIDES